MFLHVTVNQTIKLVVIHLTNTAVLSHVHECIMNLNMSVASLNSTQCRTALDQNANGRNTILDWSKAGMLTEWIDYQPHCCPIVGRNCQPCKIIML